MADFLESLHDDDDDNDDDDDDDIYLVSQLEQSWCPVILVGNRQAWGSSLPLTLRRTVR